MPSLEDLLATRRAAVEALEEKQRNLQSTADYKDAVQDAVDTAWRAAAGGVALAQADDDPQFRVTLTGVLDNLISGKRNLTLLAEWKEDALHAPDGDPAAKADPKHDVNLRRRRKAEVRRELEVLSPDELLEKLVQAEADHRQQKEDVASVRAKAATAAADLRSRDRHWRVVVGLSVLTHAGEHPDFCQKLDEIFSRRVAEKDLVLLNRWRNNNATPTASTPPTDDAASTPADDALPGGVPRKLPDKTWGAALLSPGSKDLPSELVGLSIRVTPRKGDPWITRIIEVIESTDDRILVRHEGRPGFPAPENSPATRTSYDAASPETASPRSGTGTEEHPRPGGGVISSSASMADAGRPNRTNRRHLLDRLRRQPEELGQGEMNDPVRRVHPAERRRRTTCHLVFRSARSAANRFGSHDIMEWVENLLA